MYFCRHCGFSIFQNELSRIDTDETNFYHYYYSYQLITGRYYCYPGVMDKKYVAVKGRTGKAYNK